MKKTILKASCAAGLTFALTIPAIAQDMAKEETVQTAAETAAQSVETVSAADEGTLEEVVIDYEENTKGLLPEVEADGCEMHIWPAERMASATSGLLGGGLIDAALSSGTDASNKALMASALDSPSQLDALQELDLREMLALTPGTTIIRHEEPLERKTMNKVKTRRSDSASTCYKELVVADVLYEKRMIYGRSLSTLFMVRDFGDDQKIDKQFKSWGGNGLKLFPPKEGEDAIAALDELNSVFQGNFEEYAKKAKKRFVKK